MRRIVLLALLASLAACRPSADTPQGTARRFVDEHYVRIDLAAAKQYCTGLAAHKVENEQDLTRGQVIDASTRKPRVYYTLLDTKSEGDDRVSFVFEGSIRVEDAGTFKKKWLVTTKKTGAAWKVSNFQEFDEPSD